MSDGDVRMRLKSPRVAALITAIACGLLVGAALLGPSGRRLAMPGPLQSFHAALASDCGHCHEASAEAVLGPLHGVVSSDMALAQSRRCLACHAGLTSSPLHPHGWSEVPGAVTARSAAASSGGNRPGDAPASDSLLPGADLLRVPVSSEGEIACATCHHEHRGRNDPLIQVQDSQCQSCHERRIDSFAGNHPEFDGYPHRRGQRLAFDHEAHIARHFGEPASAAHAPGACTSCHVADESGDHVLLRGYDAACAACHDAEVRGASAVAGAGWPVLDVPALDVTSLRARELPIGDWPADAAITEARLPALAALLLSADVSVRAALLTTEALDLLDLHDATGAQLSAVARMAREVKRLLAELANEGPEALRRRIEKLVGHPIDDERATNLVGQFPATVMTGAVAAWLPDLDAELSLADDDPALQAQAPVDTASSDLAGDADRDRCSTLGGWFRQDVDFTVRYHPQGHADPFLRAWIDLAGELAGTDSGRFARALIDELRGTPGPGSCLRCHALQSLADGSLHVPWTERPRIAALTHFRHATHFVAVGEEGCLACHRPGSADGTLASTPAPDGETGFAPGLQPLSRRDCTGCHTEELAAERCLTCHDYHARSGPQAPRSAPLMPPASGAHAVPREHDAPSAAKRGS